jgi:protease YdgD
LAAPISLIQMTFAGLLVAVSAGQGAADDSMLLGLQTGDDASGWEAVGRLDIDGRGFCTGTLIAPDLVLTAAHCLFDHDTGIRVEDGSIEFLAGWRNGRALAYRDVERAVLHPDYVHQGMPQGNDSQFDLALLQLDQPIRSTGINPFEIGTMGDIGDQVGIVSYAFDRADVPSLQEVCGVLGQQSGVIVMSCEVDFGSSGAPIFHIQDGEARIVSVVSAKADLDGENVAIGVVIDGPLDTLRAAFDTGDSLFRDGLPGEIRVINSGERAEIGAKFVRP